jgi:hypothetical protein
VIWVALVCVAVVAAGWSSDGSAPAAETSNTATVASTGATTTEPALVGRWERVNECEQLFGAFKDAGLEKIASSFVGDFFPDADPQELARKDDLCEGAAPFTHFALLHRSRCIRSRFTGSVSARPAATGLAT